MTTTSKTNLMTASREWASRPSDERFWTLAELHASTKQYREETSTATVALNRCRVAPSANEDLVLMGPTGGGAKFTHYSFGQLSNIAGAPASWLRSLPAELAAQNLNYGLGNVNGGEHVLLFHQNGGRQLRCVTSDGYQRIWNHEIAELGLALESRGWRTPPARPTSDDSLNTRIATEDDCLRHRMAGLGIQPGMKIAPAGLYASDHDCFIFQVNEDRPIDGGGGETLYRGVFWSNSEVGDAKFRGTMFLYESVCGNHIVWGANVVAEISIRHVGDARRKFQQAFIDVMRSTNVTAAQDQQRIQAAKTKLLAATKQDVCEWVFKTQLLGRRQTEDAYALAEKHAEIHGDPRTAWGFAAGVTRLSQLQPYADTRNQMDRAAGKILSSAF